jgi:tryptophan 2,3-dioxygenase
MVSVIETMTPTDFLKFRDRLRPASGFQSGQFRELEFLCGVRDERYIKMFEGNPAAQARLKKRLGEKPIWDHFVGALARRGLKVGDEAAQRAAIVTAYQDDSFADIRALCEAMINYDELFSLWREHHVRMAAIDLSH